MKEHQEQSIAPADWSASAVDRIFSSVKIRFETKADRAAFRQKVANEIAQAAAVARIHADMVADVKITRLNDIIGNLRFELHRAHQRHASDLIQAHGASENIQAMGVSGKVATNG